jgi:hypothetical protein
MKRAPHVKNHSLSRTLHRLRTNRHAQIKISKRQKSMTPLRRDPYRPKASKTHDGIARKSPVQPACPTKFRETAPLKSP